MVSFAVSTDAPSFSAMKVSAKAFFSSASRDRCLSLRNIRYCNLVAHRMSELVNRRPATVRGPLAENGPTHWGRAPARQPPTWKLPAM